LPRFLGGSTGACQDVCTCHDMTDSGTQTHYSSWSAVSVSEAAYNYILMHSLFQCDQAGGLKGDAPYRSLVF
jgi:hypothetical protein